MLSFSPKSPSLRHYCRAFGSRRRMLEGPQPEKPKTHKAVLRLSNPNPLSPAERIKRDSRIEDLRVQVRTLSQAGVGERMRDKEGPRVEQKTLTNNVIVRRINFPESRYIGYDGRQCYPGHPLNFDCLRPIPPNCMNSPLDRAVREVPWQPRAEILDNRVIEPKYMSECKGTPRQEYQEGLLDGIRGVGIEPVRFGASPPSAFQMYNYWSSRDNDSWDPRKTSLRGGRKMYNIPVDLFPYKDELGEWHPPRISGRYAADVRKQYYIHSLPWVWDDDAMDAGKKHFMDREPLGNKRWFRREYRKAKTAEAMRGMDALVEEYRKEARAAKPYTWFERTVHEIAGNQIAPKYVRVRKLPKM